MSATFPEKLRDGKIIKFFLEKKAIGVILFLNHFHGAELMNNNNPFESLKAAWLPLAGVVSEIRDEDSARRLMWHAADRDTFTADDELGVFTLRIENLPGRIKFRTSVVWKKNIPEHLVFTPVTFPAFGIGHAFFCGERMGRAQVAAFPVKESKTFQGRHYSALTSNKETVVMTTPLNQKYDNFFRAQGVGGLLLKWRCDFEFHHNDLPQETEFDTVTIAYGDGFEILENYGDESCEVKRDFSQKPECGWNSWDYYRWTVTEEEVLKNAEFIASDPVLKQHVKRIIVDDGWQYCYGEWEPKSLFPGGMKFLADELRKMGFKAGLWLAPAIVEPHCRIAQWDPGMLALSEGGQPCLAYRCMERYGFVLDPTVPAVQKHLEQLFDRYAGMGYEYFKLDFLGATMDARRFHDRSVPRCQVLRKLMAAVCKGVAGRSEILGCNYHFYNGNSFVNSVRVGGDIHSHWQSVKTNTVSVAGMFWENKKLWINDPDFSLCRGLESSDDPDIQRLKALYVYCKPGDQFNSVLDYNLASTGLEEQKVLLSLDIMAGGAINLSDKMPLLNEDGVDLARRVVAAESGFGGRPLDFFERELPMYWHQNLKKGGRFLVINWEDTPQEINVDWSIAGNPAEAKDFWSGKIEKCSSKVMLAPHSCKLWEY